MVRARTGTVHLEIVPWLTQPRLILEEDVDGPVKLGDFLASLAGKYPAIRTTILDVGADGLSEHVSIVHNDTALASGGALEVLVRAGDSLVFLPAFSGG